MAKDGTNRGGRRAKAGKKPASLYEKIQNGKSAVIMEPPTTELNGFELESPESIQGNAVPNPSEYLSQIQRDGNSLGADEIYKETWEWLKDRGCEKIVNNRLLESYSQAFARFIQCEDAISRYGLLGKHPTTGGAIASPFVQMGQSYQKQANLLWYEIYDIVKQNCTHEFTGNPQADMMERLLNSKK